MVETAEICFEDANDTHIEKINKMGIGDYISIYIHGEIVGTFENTYKGYEDTFDIISKYQNTDIYIYFPP